MKHILAIFMLLVSSCAMANVIRKDACVDEPAKAYMLWKEARGEPLQAQRAVLDVLYHRMLKSRLTACKELMKPSQYPYFKHGVKPVSKEWLTHYRKVRMMPKVLMDESYLYFNRKKHKWATGHRKIGNLTFSKEKK